MKKLTAVLSTVGLAFVLSSPVSAQNAPHDASGMREACAADQAKLCADVKSGMPMMQCMQRNANKVSDGCKTAMTAMRSRGMGAGQAGPAAASAGGSGGKPQP